MGAEWLVVKFVADLRRDEPRNVGLMLDVDGQRRARFAAEGEDGRPDGRRVRWTDSDNWARWVQYWRGTWIEDRYPVEDMLIGEQSNNFRVVRGGRLLAGDAVEDVDEFFDEIWSVVGPKDQASQKPRKSEFHSKVRTLFSRAELLQSPYLHEGRTIPLREGYGDQQFPWHWSNGTNMVAQELPALRQTAINDATFKASLLPPTFGNITFVPESADDTKLNMLYKVGHVAPIDELSPEDLRAMLAERQQRKLVLSAPTR